jgi:hypothetical protein
MRLKIQSKKQVGGEEKKGVGWVLFRWALQMHVGVQFFFFAPLWSLGFVL